MFSLFCISFFCATLSLVGWDLVQAPPLSREKKYFRWKKSLEISSKLAILLQDSSFSQSCCRKLISFHFPHFLAYIISSPRLIQIMKRSGTNEEKKCELCGKRGWGNCSNAFLPLQATEKSSKSSASASLLLFPPSMSSSSSSFRGWGILTHISQHIRGERKGGGKT